MRLYLVQHGDAKDKEEDPERPLTEAGTCDVKKVAEFLQSLELPLSVVWHSGKTRARQTAEILAEAFSVAEGVVQQDGLSPKDDVKPVAEKLAASSSDVMVVGHMPFMSKIAAQLITGNDSSEVVAFNKGGVVCLDGEEVGGFSVLWIVTPAVLG